MVERQSPGLEIRGGVPRSELAPLALLYRWVVVLSSLTVAYVAMSDVPVQARLAAAGPIMMSLTITLISYWPRASRWLLAALGLDIVVGTACVVATGGVESPFLFYLSAPLLRSAIMTWVVPMVVGSLGGVMSLVVIHSLDDNSRSTLLFATNELAVLLAGPWLVFAVVRRLGAASHSVSALQEARPVLAPEDRDLLENLRTGATYAEIAESSGFSVETIKVRVARVYRRLGAANRAEAIARADALGLRKDSSAR
jgi:DNA-binding CsgD family transcriptional regulator